MSDIFIPPIGTFRTIFLYVGQGDATLMIVPDGNSHKYVLIDSNKDDTNISVDIAAIIKGKIPKGQLIFINTHPHKDHLNGIDTVHKAITIGEIWHSGHLPHKDNREEYTKMQSVISEIGEGKEFYLRGSRELNVVHNDKDETSKVTRKIGDVDYQVLSPAKYVCDDIDDETPEARRQRIHEQCGVIRFTYKNKGIMITGDSDKKAWAEHITPYYNDCLGANALSASHHGSRSFFKDGEDDETPFKEHIEKINPEYLIISAPKESPHDHPHDDAMELYKEYVPEEGIFNLGDKEQSVVIDIDSSGNQSVEWVDFSQDESVKENKPSPSLYPYKPTGISNVKPYCSYGNN